MKPPYLGNLLLRLSFLVRDELSLFLRTDVFKSINGFFFFIDFKPRLCFLALDAITDTSKSAISCKTKSFYFKFSYFFILWGGGQNDFCNIL